LPVLYVSHAPDEVSRLADHLVLIEAGRVRASGPLPEIATRADLAFGQRDDAGAVLACRVVGHDAARALTRLDAGGTTLLVPLMATPPGTTCRVRIPAREVILAGAPPASISVQNIVAGTVRRIAEEAERRAVLVEVTLQDAALLARVTPDAIARLALASGSGVLALIKSTSIEVLGP